MIISDEPGENNDMAEVLKEMREFKGILNDVKARQIEMEKTLLKINKKLNSTDFDLSKSAHAVSTVLYNIVNFFALTVK